MAIADAVAGGRVYLDTNVFIYAVEGLAPYSEPMKELFARVDSGQVQAVTSELTLAEALVKSMMDSNAGLVEVYKQAITSSEGLWVIPISRSVLLRAAQIRGQQQALKLPDAIHVATAEVAGCASFLTNDERLKTTDGIPVVICSDVL
jgi:predicted nucleic acid-binding protein